MLYIFPPLNNTITLGYLFSFGILQGTRALPAPGALGLAPACRADSSLQETVVTSNDNRKYSQHSCSSSILFLTAQSHFLHEIVLQCLQDNNQ